MGVVSRLAHAFNVFVNPDSDFRASNDLGIGYGGRPDRVRLRFSNERTIITSIYMRIALDVAAVDIRHVRLDEEGRYLEDMKSGLNNCLSLEANLDQNARHFIKDVVLTMFDEGTSVVTPIEYSADPLRTGTYEIETMRVGRVVQWYPQHVRVTLYNELNSKREDITRPKRLVGVVENPLYEVMNEPNSTLQRLLRKLNLLDSVDEQSASGKLDIVIQLPYNIRSEQRRLQAEQRRKDIEFQLKGSQYGIAYIDGTEKVTQLNRPAENNLFKQVEYLTEMLYGQLGITAEVMNGTADEKTMLNYYNRTIEPILAAISMEMKRKFLTKTARTQGQSVEIFRDPFKLVTMENFAEMVDKFTRNEVFTSNEMRQFVGIKPSKDPKADKLLNSNLNHPEDGAVVPGEVVATEDDTVPALDNVMGVVDEMIAELEGSLDGGA